jgi:hypothetical protein
VIVLAVLLLGLVAPFVLIYGALSWLLILPFTTAFSYVRPYWLRLSPQRRHTIKKATAWTLSITLWISIIYASTHSSN